MKPRSAHRLTPLLVLSALLATSLPAAGQITFYTTDDYDAQSTSEDMAVSCKNVWLSSNTVGASCNKKSGSSGIADNRTTLDLTTVVYCKDDQGLANTVIT